MSEGGQPLEASFRDPSGFLFVRDGVLYRQINEKYLPHYQRLMDALYPKLVENQYLVAHEETAEAPMTDSGRLVIRPDPIAYISYPYEWSFAQLKDAALLTLDIQSLALEHSMTLKDATGFNVQFAGNRPIFIDTLSFEILNEEVPWVAYRQFCQHFLAPLAVMAYKDVRARHLLKSFIDGIPLDLASNLLPRRSYFNYSVLAHVHLHANSQRRHQDDGASGEVASSGPKVSLLRLQALVASLRRAISRLELPEKATEWGDYYDDTNYSDEGMSEKERLVHEMLADHAYSTDIVHDVGANTGRFSAIAARHGARVIAHDVDELAVHRHYSHLRDSQVNITPLVLDVTNPTPAIGWRLAERTSFAERTSGGFVMALALVHHLAISNNLPLPMVAQFFAEIADKLIIEFVPKTDSQVRRLLATREDIFPNYTEEHFESAFAQQFQIVNRTPIADTHRTLYYMERIQT